MLQVISPSYKMISLKNHVYSGILKLCQYFRIVPKISYVAMILMACVLVLVGQWGTTLLGVT